MKKISSLLFALTCLSISITFAQNKKSSNEIARPKLVVGIAVDQMRWDYLYRYYNRYSEGGFKRLLNKGFSCENTYINYLPSYTAVGHTTIFTGSVPSIDGIAGNDWIEQLTGKRMYCTSDSTVNGVGSTTESADGKMSPRNLLVSTITDELRLATNFKSQVIGVSLKDRASILPAGHLGKAFWFDDKSGNFITSTYYSNELPTWVSNFNNQKNVLKLIDKGWNTLYPINTYTQSTADNVIWEGKYAGEQSPTFPHDLKAIYEKNKSVIRSCPFGNTLTLALATEAVKSNKMGQGAATDFLTINCASTDYVGHQFGPNSIEIEDTYLRLDKDLESFFAMLDAQVGAGNYTVFLTADHGAAHAVNFMKENKLPAEIWNSDPLVVELNKLLSSKYGQEKLIRDIANYQVNFDLAKIEKANLDFDAIKKICCDYLRKQPGISYAVDIEKVNSLPIPEPLKTMVVNGYNFKRSGQIQVILDAGWFEGHGLTGTTHGTWNPYDIHIPLLWYGWGIKAGQTNTAVNMTDISATVAALLHIQMPNGCIGKPITDITNK
ncbi:alkaline phosphatase PafA [Pedobacter sp. MW01-1-1]|uniref:alkaline phosphatase PafA n=1 Tax=Pedobacter sp. MW01-1-1 TaxID=3383027 RepID=UPI003FF03A61